MFGIGHFWELLLVLLVALLVFGPKRLPEMGNAVGKTIKEFQKTMKEVTTHATTVPEEGTRHLTTVVEATPPDSAAQ